MVAFSKGSCINKISDNEEETFDYRELRELRDKNEVDDDVSVSCVSSGVSVEGGGINVVSHRPLDLYSEQTTSEKRFNFNCTTVFSTFVLILLVLFLLFVGRDYVRWTLYWLQDQEEWIVFLLFVTLFTVVSFPFTWGYILLNVAAGYLQGLVLGIIVVMVAVAVGVFIAHLSIKRFLTDFFKTKLLSNDSIRATLAVVGGPQAFKVVAFTRLTPIPFGMQNAIFAISTVSTSQYLAATILGLFPTQVINVYLGSTVRSMEDVLTDDSTATTGYIVFVVQVLISFGLMVFVVQRARQELRKTVQFQILGDLKEISVSQDSYNNCSAI